jgi:hypothetical protein
MLTDLCGPHCGIKDGYEGHCPVCHRIAELPLSADKRIQSERHLRGRR